MYPEYLDTELVTTAFEQDTEERPLPAPFARARSLRPHLSTSGCSALCLF